MPRRALVPVAALALLASAVQGQAPVSGAEIGAGDMLSVVVAGQSGLTGDFPVDAQGMLYYPFLGRVKASGMTPRELERKLTTLLSDGYLRNPQVSVEIKESRSRPVFVTGEVQRPGAQGLKGNGSLSLLLADVGLTPEAGHEVIVIRPPVAGSTPEGSANAVPSPSPSPADAYAVGEGPDAEGGEAESDETPTPEPTPEPTPPPTSGLPNEVPGSEIFRVSLRELRSGNPEKDMTLQPGDTVYVPRAAQVYVTGQAVRTGAFKYEEGMTVYQLLNLAGGPTARGSTKVRILRLVDGKPKEIKVEMTDLVLPEDTLKVPERFF